MKRKRVKIVSEPDSLSAKRPQERYAVRNFKYIARMGHNLLTRVDATALRHKHLCNFIHLKCGGTLADSAIFHEFSKTYAITEILPNQEWNLKIEEKNDDIPEKLKIVEKISREKYIKNLNSKSQLFLEKNGENVIYFSLLIKNEFDHPLRDVILVKVESTYNSDSSPGATDAVLVENPSWAYEGLRMNERPAVRESIGMRQKVYGGSLKAVSFDVELKGSGTPGTAPEIDPILEAAGLIGTNTPGTSEEYKFSSDPSVLAGKSCTIYYYQDGTRHIITGAFCSALAGFIGIFFPESI